LDANRKLRHCKPTAIVMQVTSGSMCVEFAMSRLGIEDNLYMHNIGVSLPISSAYYNIIRRCRYSYI